eukprot:gene10560-biopygen21325
MQRVQISRKTNRTRTNRTRTNRTRTHRTRTNRTRTNRTRTNRTRTKSNCTYAPKGGRIRRRTLALLSPQPRQFWRGQLPMPGCTTTRAAVRGGGQGRPGWPPQPPLSARLLGSTAGVQRGWSAAARATPGCELIFPNRKMTRVEQTCKGAEQAGTGAAAVARLALGDSGGGVACRWNEQSSVQHVWWITWTRNGMCSIGERNGCRVSNQPRGTL